MLPRSNPNSESDGQALLVFVVFSSRSINRLFKEIRISLSSFFEPSLFISVVVVVIWDGSVGIVIDVVVAGEAVIDDVIVAVIVVISVIIAISAVSFI